MPTLIAPDGREYRTSSVVEARRLTLGFGYTVKPEEEGHASSDYSAFDPSAHTVPEVQVYLDEHSEDEIEVERVLAAERAGKNRVSLVGTDEN